MIRVYCSIAAANFPSSMAVAAAVRALFMITVHGSHVADGSRRKSAANRTGAGFPSLQAKFESTILPGMRLGFVGDDHVVVWERDLRLVDVANGLTVQVP